MMIHPSNRWEENKREVEGGRCLEGQRKVEEERIKMKEERNKE